MEVRVKMSHNEDDFVEKLLKDLPKAPPMSALEIKRFEKNIDALVAGGGNRQTKRNWVPAFSVAASVIAVVAGLTIFSGNSDIVKNAVPSVTTSESAAPEPSSTSNPGASGDNGSTGVNDDRTTYGDSGSNGVTSNTSDIPSLSTGFEYSTDFKQARTAVAKIAVKGGTAKLSAAQISCSVQLGVENSLWAIDSGTYLGESIQAYYFGDSKSTLQVKIVGFGCKLIDTL
jgi:hypothetical protein